MNWKTFDRLSAKARTIITENSGEILARRNGVAFDERYARYLARTKRNTSHNFTFPSAQERESLQRKLQPVTERWIERNSEGRKRYEAVAAILRDIRKAK